jgi:hypothetical protein
LDNSVLVTGVGNDIHIIDAPTGHVAKSLHVGKSISQVAIVGRHLLSLHDNASMFSCWDLVNGHIIFTERIDQLYSSIAVNHNTSTFALAASTSNKSSITISRIVSNKKVDEVQIRLDSVVTNLLDSELDEFSGYVFVDGSGSGQVGHISAQAATATSVTNSASELVSKIIPVQVRRVELEKSVDSRQMVQTSRILDQDIKNVLEMGNLGIASMYETIVQSMG